MSMALPAFALGLLVTTGSALACDGDMCGPSLVKRGWQEIARCHDGHSWAYVLEQGNERLVCTGGSGYAGPVEYPCRTFSGDIDRFRLIASQSGPGASRGPFHFLVKGPAGCPQALHQTYGWER
jgi:hypothetical protein